jgi:hypothetical protein
MLSAMYVIVVCALAEREKPSASPTSAHVIVANRFDRSVIERLPWGGAAL